MGAPDCPDCGSSDTHVQPFGRKKYKCENDNCPRDRDSFGPETQPI